MKLGTCFEEALDAMSQIGSIPELTLLLFDLRDALGVANLVYHAVEVPGCPIANPILALSYEEAWIDRYFAENYFVIDPVVLSGKRGFLPYDWADLDRSSNAARHLFREADQHGVGRQGVTIPIRAPGGERALFTVTSNLPNDKWERSRWSLLRECHALAFYFHERAVFLSGMRGERPPQLSNREKQCLQLLASGDKPKGIARSLDLSLSAVRLYLRSARTKLHCATLPQAVAHALRLEMIHTR